MNGLWVVKLFMLADGYGVPFLLQWADIFIAYSSRDREQAEQLTELL